MLASFSSESVWRGKMKKFFSVNVKMSFLATDLSDRRGEKIDNFLMWHCDNTLIVDFDNPMPNSYASALCDAATQQTTNLKLKTHAL
jgi:hypothetical protein